MLLIRNPFVWLARFSYRCGYGIHSPFAFQFVEGVLYEHATYYAYHDLDAELHWWEMFRRRSFLHLLFRLSNFSQPTIVYASGIDHMERKYLSAGAQKAHFIDHYRDEKVDFIFMGSPDASVLTFMGKGCIVVAKDIDKYPDWWRIISHDARVSVVFDLYDVGILFCRPDLNLHYYKINW